jgi:hypothetical protein
MTKLLNFKCNVSQFNFAYLILTETWLTKIFYDNELGLFNYNIYRSDRCSNSSNCNRGGGVLNGVRKDISSHLILISETNVEQIFVKFSIGAFCYVVGGVYIPPHSIPGIYKSHVKSIESITCQFKDHIYII